MLGARAVPGEGVGWVFVPIERAWVKGNAGGRLLCGMGSTAERGSTLPLCTKTRALGLATMTRGGGVISRPEGDRSSSAGLGSCEVGRLGGATVGGSAGASGTACVGDFWGKSGVVFEAAGAPVTGGAIGLAGGCWGGADFAVMLGIGLVTAVDHAGGELETGAGSIC